MSKLSIIIVAYNCKELLKECIGSIRDNNDLGDDLEIIVVDNGSDGTYEQLKCSEYQEIKTVKAENRGFGAGNNAGVEIATGLYYLFLNPDTIMQEPVCSFAVETFKQNSDLGCFGVRMLDEYGNDTSSITLRYYLGFWRHQLNRLITGLGIYLPDKMYTSGAGLFVRAETFKKIGGFDEQFFMYCEEPDICNRVNSAGYRCGYFPEKSIVHLEGKTSDEKLASKYIVQLRAWKHYCEKYGIDFQKAARKEKRYCKFKRNVFCLLKKKEKGTEYSKIVSALECYLNGGEL